MKDNNAVSVSCTSRSVQASSLGEIVGKEKDKESAGLSRIVYIRGIAYIRVCVYLCVCVHVHVHASTCACISDTSIVQVFVIVMCGMDVVSTEFAIYGLLWSPPNSTHP